MQSEAETVSTMEREEESEQVEQHVCPVCGKVFQTLQSLRGHMRIHKRKDEKVESEALSEEGKAGEAVEAPSLPPPPEVEIIEKAIEFLKERLPQVYGIEKYDKIIISSLKEDPRPLVNPTTLHAFIKSIAPRAYDSHLSVHVINPLYAKFPNLPQAVTKHMESSYQSMQPFYTYPQYPQTPHINPYYQYYPYYPYYQYYQIQPYITPPPPPKPLRTYKVVVDGQEIETDEAGYMAWQRFLREREEHERRKQEHEMMMKKLEIEIKKALEGGGESKREEELSKKIDEISKKLEEERERRHQAELELLKREVEELKKRPSLLEELSIYEGIAERLGFRRGGRTTIDLLESFVERLDQRAAQLLNKIPSPGSEWRPEIKRTPEERARKAEEIMKRLEKSEEIMKLEEELIKAAANIKPKGGQTGETP